MPTFNQLIKNPRINKNHKIKLTKINHSNPKIKYVKKYNINAKISKIIIGASKKQNVSNYLFAPHHLLKIQ